MKRILLAVMFGIGVLGFAQPSREKTKEIIKEQIVDKIKGYKPTDLVPYSKDGKIEEKNLKREYEIQLLFLDDLSNNLITLQDLKKYR